MILNLKLLSKSRGVCYLLFALTALALPGQAAGPNRPEILWVKGGHSQEVWYAAASPVGGSAATASFDGTVKLWNLADGSLIRTFTERGSQFQSLGFSPDGQLLGAYSRYREGANEGNIRVWRVSDGILMKTLGGAAADNAEKWFPGALSFSSDSSYVAFRSETRTWIWRYSDGVLLTNITPVVLSSDFRHAAFGDGVHQILSAGTFSPPSDSNRMQTLSHVGSAVGFTDGDSTVYGWAKAGGMAFEDWRSRTRLQWFAAPTGSNAEPTGDDLSADGRLLVHTYKNPLEPSARSIQLWDRTASPSPNGQISTSVWQQDYPNTFSVFFGSKLFRPCFSADGNTLVLPGRTTARLLRVSDGLPRTDLPNLLQGELLQEINGVRSVAYSPNGQTLAVAVDYVGSDDFQERSGHLIHLRRTSDGLLVRTIAGHTQQVNAVAFSPDGMQLASGALDGSLRIWNPATGALLFTLPTPGGVHRLAFSPNGAYLAVACAGGMRVWHQEGSNWVEVWNDGNPTASVAFSPGSDRLAALQRNPGLRIFSVPDGVLQATLNSIDNGGSEKWGGPLSWMGSRLAADRSYWMSGYQTRIECWDTSSNTLSWFHPLEGGNVSSEGLAFAPNSSRLAAAVNNGTLRFYDPATGDLREFYDCEIGPVGNPGGQNGALHSLAYSPTGAQFAYGREDATLVTASAPGADAVKPTCVQIGTAANPTRLFFQVRDTGSGLASIQATVAKNCTVTWPAFTPGSTAPVVVTATKINQSQKAQVELRITDQAGNVLVCDPVIANLAIKKTRHLSRTYKGLPGEEHYVTLENGAPGLQRFAVTVNGRHFGPFNLADGQVLRLDTAAAMRPGSRNTFRVQVSGPKGATALLLIGDASLAGTPQGKSHPTRDAGLDWGP